MQRHKKEQKVSLNHVPFKVCLPNEQTSGDMACIISLEVLIDSTGQLGGSCDQPVRLRTCNATIGRGFPNEYWRTPHSLTGLER